METMTPIVSDITKDEKLAILTVNPTWFQSLLTSSTCVMVHPVIVVGAPKECPKGDRTRVDGKCRKRLWTNILHQAVWCSGVHGVVYQGEYDGIYVEVN